MRIAIEFRIQWQWMLHKLAGSATQTKICFRWLPDKFSNGREYWQTSDAFRVSAYMQFVMSREVKVRITRLENKTMSTLDVNYMAFYVDTMNACRSVQNENETEAEFFSSKVIVLTIRYE